MAEWVAAIAASIAVLVAAGQGWYTRSQAKSAAQQALEALRNSELLAEASREAKDEAEQQAKVANEARLAAERIAATLDGQLKVMEKLAAAAEDQGRTLAQQLVQYQDSLKRADLGNVHREKVELINAANDFFLAYDTSLGDFVASAQRRSTAAAAFSAQMVRTIAVLRQDAERALLDDEFWDWLDKYEKIRAGSGNRRKSERAGAERTANTFKNLIVTRLQRLLDT